MEGHILLIRDDCNYTHFKEILHMFLNGKQFVSIKPSHHFVKFRNSHWALCIQNLT